MGLPWLGEKTKKVTHYAQNPSHLKGTAGRFKGR